MKHRSVVSNFIFSQRLSSFPGEAPEVLNNPDRKIRVALFRRSFHPDVHTYQGKLAPISGSIEGFDADATAAAARELREETQLIPGQDVRLEFAGKPFHIEDQNIQRSWTVYPFAWTLLANPDKVKLDWEHDELQWVLPADILTGKLQHDCVPKLDKSLRRVYFGIGGMFRGLTPESPSGRVFLQGLEGLKTDKENGARVLATNAVRCLLEIVNYMNLQDDWWHDLRVAAYHLIYSARPSMNAAISSAVLDALHQNGLLACKSLDRDWVIQKLKKYIDYRNDMSTSISSAFICYIKDLTIRNETDLHITILTLSFSSTISSGILALLKYPLPIHIHLSILESRPRCEGASLAAALLKNTQYDSTLQSRLHLTIAPDSHITHLIQCARANLPPQHPAILLLGADRISPSGHVSNKMGSYTAAIVAKAIAPEMKVVVLSESDKIAKPTNLSIYVNHAEDPAKELEEHAIESNDPDEVSGIWAQAGARSDTANVLKEGGADVQNVYFEWLPRDYIDVYLTEDGVLERKQIRRRSIMQAEIEETLFEGLYEE